MAVWEGWGGHIMGWSVGGVKKLGLEFLEDVGLLGLNLLLVGVKRWV